MLTLFEEIVSPSVTVNLTLTGLPDGVGLSPVTSAFGVPRVFAFGEILTYSLFPGPH